MLELQRHDAVEKRFDVGGSERLRVRGGEAEKESEG
jgi:hypothetical protein